MVIWGNKEKHSILTIRLQSVSPQQTCSRGFHCIVNPPTVKKEMGESFPTKRKKKCCILIHNKIFFMNFNYKT